MDDGALPLVWLQDAAQRVAGLLESRGLARERRSAARQALASAFDALEAGQVDGALLAALEALLGEAAPPFKLRPWPLGVAVTHRTRPLARRPFRSAVRMRGALDPVLLERFEWRWALHDRIVDRLQQVIDTFKTPTEPLARAEPRALALADGDLDLPLTRG